LNINKEELSRKFKEKDWDYVFKRTFEITDFILSNGFKIYDPSIKNDYKQECAENLYKKILAGKVDADKNLFAFIWMNSRFRILEILRKKRKRSEIAHFISYDALETTDYIDNRYGVGDRYIPEEMMEAWVI